MKNKLQLVMFLFLFTSFITSAAITECEGWLESVFVKWERVSGADEYNVYYTGGNIDDRKIDSNLIRYYGAYFRADIPGLTAGNYTLRIVPVVNGNEDTSGEMQSQPVYVQSHSREGFAFVGPGGRVIPGAYKEDGTPKDGAKIIYVSASNVNSVESEVFDNKGNGTIYTGLSEILAAKGKGYDKTPLIIRVIGTIRDTEIAGLKDGNFISLTGFNNKGREIENVTIEGIGDDAVLYGYGVTMKRSKGIEIRNLAIMWFGDDALSMDTDNSNIWIHNNDLFYGRPGKDADQVKGDGTIDMKYNSTYISISYNHFWDSGKTMGCGGGTETVPTLYITFNHNWFDHTDSRNPRLHYVTAHIYNNYFDGVAKYCIGNTTESSAFIDSNYFRNSDRPMMISGQGTDTYNSSTGAYDQKGTFSGQDGGMTKAFNNLFSDTPKLVYQTDNEKQFDAYLVNKRTDKIPESVKSVRGAFSYTNFDTAPDMYAYNANDPDEVESIVTKLAGRVKGGDIKYEFDYASEDDNYEIIPQLKDMLLNYQSSLIGIQGEATSIEKNVNDKTIKFYPNPVKDYLYIDTDEKIKNISFFTNNGALELSDNSGKKSVNVSTLSSGVYIVNIKTDKGTHNIKVRK